jgi:hypothetical protein
MRVARERNGVPKSFRRIRTASARLQTIAREKNHKTVMNMILAARIAIKAW